ELQIAVVQKEGGEGPKDQQRPGVLTVGQQSSDRQIDESVDVQLGPTAHAQFKFRHLRQHFEQPLVRIDQSADAVRGRRPCDEAKRSDDVRLTQVGRGSLLAAEVEPGRQEDLNRVAYRSDEQQQPREDVSQIQV